MAKKIPSYKDIEAALTQFREKSVAADEVGYSLLLAFGKTHADIKRFKEGRGILTSFDGLLIKGLLGYKAATKQTMNQTLEQMKLDRKVIQAAAKIIAVSDGESILAYDMRNKETYENPLDKVCYDFIFFYPLCGVEKSVHVQESDADIRAAEKLARLHDELRAYNEFKSSDEIHDLNIFISRLLFCYFAEDTGIFEENLFTNSIERYTKVDGSDLAQYLDEAFNIMNVSLRNEQTNKVLLQFPYVNGGLFSKKIKIPKMGWKARQIIIECGSLGWQNINPDIFGSMIQSVVNPEERGEHGMHYTSVPNIMKVISPLFLNELRAEFRRLEDIYEVNARLRDVGELTTQAFFKEVSPIVKGCRKLLLRISKMKFFDPACGSGNFLIITYKMLRLLEMDILRLIRKCRQEQELDFIDSSCITLQQFYGIELLDFPHETAMLSLWLAEHQMNCKFHKDFGVNINALPLKSITQIVCGNACRMDWNTVCPHEVDEEVYVFGNPPYLGARLQEKNHKEDLERVFGKNVAFNNLDYISAWFYKGANYIRGNSAQFAFVTTNSICQGEQVSLLWDNLLSGGLEISFAYTSFKWSNNAKHNAGVTVVIVGIRNANNTPKYIIDGALIRKVNNINPYLVNGPNTTVGSESSSISGFPTLNFGSMPNDGGYLLLNAYEKKNLLEERPEVEPLIHPILGSQEYIKGEERYCLWITDSDLKLALSIREVKRRIEGCRKVRSESKRASTNKLAEIPHKFGEIRYQNSPCIIIPRVSSESREYIPIGYLDAGNVVSDSAFAIYNAPYWLFGILTSRMHIAWVRTVGGKLETRYRYSAGLCYNTFPFPEIPDSKRKEIEDAAKNVLICRADHPLETMEQLYNAANMPQDLREAHARLDDVVDSCYQGYPFASDEERLECLFRMYNRLKKRE